MIASVWLIGFAITVQVPPPGASAAESGELQQVRQAIRERETAELRALADRLGAAGRRAEADAALRLIESAPPVEGPTHFIPLPEVVPARSKGQGLANVPADRRGLGDSRELAAVRQ